MNELLHSEPMFGGMFTIYDRSIFNGNCYLVTLKIDGCEFSSSIHKLDISYAKKILFEKIALHAKGVDLLLAESYLNSSRMFLAREQKRYDLAQQLLKHI